MMGVLCAGRSESGLYFKFTIAFRVKFIRRNRLTYSSATHPSRGTRRMMGFELIMPFFLGPGRGLRSA